MHGDQAEGERRALGGAVAAPCLLDAPGADVPAPGFEVRTGGGGAV